jgi:hypothetical protein
MVFKKESIERDKMCSRCGQDCGGRCGFVCSNCGHCQSRRSRRSRRHSNRNDCDDKHYYIPINIRYFNGPWPGYALDMNLIPPQLNCQPRPCGGYYQY